MNFVVAGVVLLISFAVGVISTVIAPRLIIDDEKVNNDTTLATSTKAFFIKENLSKILVLLMFALMSGTISYILCLNKVGIIDIIKYILVLEVVLSAMIIDAKRQIIPNCLVLFLIVSNIILLIANWIVDPSTVTLTLIMNVAGLLICVVLFYALSRLTKNGIGMGDVKLIAAIAFTLGLTVTLTIVLISLISCTVTAVVLIFMKKKKKTDSMPFAPFLFFGYILLNIISAL